MLFDAALLFGVGSRTVLGFPRGLMLSGGPLGGGPFLVLLDGGDVIPEVGSGHGRVSGLVGCPTGGAVEDAGLPDLTPGGEVYRMLMLIILIGSSGTLRRVLPARTARRATRPARPDCSSRRVLPARTARRGYGRAVDHFVAGYATGAGRCVQQVSKLPRSADQLVEPGAGVAHQGDHVGRPAAQLAAVAAGAGDVLRTPPRCETSPPARLSRPGGRGSWSGKADPRSPSRTLNGCTWRLASAARSWVGGAPVHLGTPGHGLSGTGGGAHHGGIGSTTLSGISDRFYLAVQQPRRSTGVPAALLQLQGRLRGSGRATLPCISARIVSVPLKQEHRLDGLIAAIAIRSRELGREFNERAERRRLTEGAIDVEDLQQQADTLAAELRQQETERTERARARDNRPARCPDCNRVCCNCNEREPEPS